MANQTINQYQAAIEYFTMTYTPNMQAAARRHLEAADLLTGSVRYDVAGYLYGIAAECAVKAMMLEAGLRPLSDDQRRDDPFYAHFPGLKTLLQDAQLGRNGNALLRCVRDSSFMQYWDTDMRYSKGGDIKKKWTEDWKRQARDVVASIGT